MLWHEVDFEQALSADAANHDVNAIRRAEVLWALQFEQQPDDLALLRWLVAQEALCCRQASFQRLNEETLLAGWLLATRAQIEDVWLQREVKTANVGHMVRL